MKKKAKIKVQKKQFTIDGKLLNVFLSHAEENYQEFVHDFEESKANLKKQRS